MNQSIVKQYQSEAEIFKALAHPIRLFIIHELQIKKLCVTELTNKMDIDISTMSRHLGVLKKHQIIVGEKVNNNVFYTLNIPCVLDFMICANNVINNNKN